MIMLPCVLFSLAPACRRCLLAHLCEGDMLAPVLAQAPYQPRFSCCLLRVEFLLILILITLTCTCALPEPVQERARGHNQLVLSVAASVVDTRSCRA